MFRLLTFVGVLHLVGLAANFVNGSFTNEVQSSYLSCIANLSLETLNATSVNITWTSTFEDNFNVSISTAEYNFNTFVNVSGQEQDLFTAVIGNLCPQTVYVFKVTNQWNNCNDDCDTLIHSIDANITGLVTDVNLTSNINTNALPRADDRLKLFVSWNSPSQVNCPITSYTIQWHVNNGEILNLIQTQNTYVQFNSSNAWLLPITNYTFSIIPNTLSGPGEVTTVTITTNDDVPWTPPTFVNVSTPSLMTVKVQWTPPAITNSILNAYKVYIIRENGFEENYTYSSDTFNDQYNHFKISELICVKVSAINVQGEGPLSAKKCVRTYENAITGLSIETFNSTSVNISWSSNNFVEYFSILYFASISGLKERINVTRQILNESTLEGYSIENECGTIVYSIESYITSPVTELSFTSIIDYDTSPGSRNRLHLHISWSSPQDIYCPIASYTIHWKIINSTFWRETQTTKTFISFNSSNDWLKPSYNYSISITPNTLAGFGQVTYRNITIINDVPWTPPYFVNVSTPSFKTVKVQWEPPTIPNSLLNELSYKVYIRRENGSIEHYTYNYTIESVEFNHFDAFELVCIKTSAINEEGEGSKSKEKCIRALESELPQITEVDVVRLSGDSMEINWTSPLFTSGIITGYEITYQAVGTLSRQSSNISSQILSAFTRQQVVSGLNSYLAYGVKIRALFETGIGPYSTLLTIPAFKEFVNVTSSAKDIFQIRLYGNVNCNADNDTLLQQIKAQVTSQLAQYCECSRSIASSINTRLKCNHNPNWVVFHVQLTESSDNIFLKQWVMKSTPYLVIDGNTLTIDTINCPVFTDSINSFDCLSVMQSMSSNARVIVGTLFAAFAFGVIIAVCGGIVGYQACKKIKKTCHSLTNKDDEVHQHYEDMDMNIDTENQDKMDPYEIIDIPNVTIDNVYQNVNFGRNDNSMKVKKKNRLKKPKQHPQLQLKPLDEDKKRKASNRTLQVREHHTFNGLESKQQLKLKPQPTVVDANIALAQEAALQDSDDEDLTLHAVTTFNFDQHHHAKTQVHMNEDIEQEDMQRIMIKHEHLSTEHSENASKKGKRKLAEPKLQLTLKPKDAVIDPNIELAQKVALQDEVGESLLVLPAIIQSTANTLEPTRVPTFNKNADTTLCTNSTELNQKEKFEMDYSNAKVDTEATPFQTKALALTKRQDETKSQNPKVSTDSMDYNQKRVAQNDDRFMESKHVQVIMKSESDALPKKPINPPKPHIIKKSTTDCNTKRQHASDGKEIVNRKETAESHAEGSTMNLYTDTRSELKLKPMGERSSQPKKLKPSKTEKTPNDSVQSKYIPPKAPKPPKMNIRTNAEATTAESLPPKPRGNVSPGILEAVKALEKN